MNPLEEKMLANFVETNMRLDDIAKQLNEALELVKGLVKKYEK